MRKIVLWLVLAIISVLYLKIGYYTSYEDEEESIIFFVKSTLTPKLRFSNIFATEEDPRPLNRLLPEQRLKVIEYCKYRVGLETDLNTQADLDACSVR